MPPRPGAGGSCGIHAYDNYVRRIGVWQIFVEARGLEVHLEGPRGWEGDGVIARIRAVAESLAQVKAQERES